MQQDVEAAVITQLEQGDENELNNQQQLVTAASKARTRQNIICSTIDTVTFSNNNAFAAFLQQKQLLEEFELKQLRLEWEDERARHEEELHEMEQNESRQQKQTIMLF
jgi:hypothetical protein